jgi:DNA-binding transcriptional LysR family regulator
MSKKGTPLKVARRYFKEVRFRQIRALVEFDRTGGFAPAALALGLSVPSVWQQIRALELEYGVALVDSQGSRMFLTPEGRMLVDLAVPLVEGFDSLRSAFEGMQHSVPLSLRVVAPAPMLSGALRAPLMHYRKQFPSVNLTLIDRPSFTARQFMERNEADLGVIGIARGDEPLKQFHVQALTAYPFQLICPKDHPLLKLSKIRLADLVSQPLLLSAVESSSHRQIRHVFTEAGFAEKMNVTMTATDRGLLMSYVRMGLGVAIGTGANTTASKQSLPGEVQIVYRDLSALFGHETVALIQRKGRYELPHVSAFRQAVIEAIR